MKMEPIVSSETSAIRTQTPGITQKGTNYKIRIPSSVTSLFTKRLDDGRSEATCNNILAMRRALNELFGFERKQTTYLMISTNGKLFIKIITRTEFETRIKR